jgi:hypothetical protein
MRSMTQIVGITTLAVMRRIYMRKGLSARKKKPAMRKNTGVEAHLAIDQRRDTSGCEGKKELRWMRITQKQQ